MGVVGVFAEVSACPLAGSTGIFICFVFELAAVETPARTGMGIFGVGLCIVYYSI